MADDPLLTAQDITNLHDRFEEIGRNPIYWLGDAQLLKRAADTIYERFEDSFSERHVEPRPGAGGIIRNPWITVDHELYRVYYALAGMALELYLKALLVQENPEIVEKGKTLEWGIGGSGHNLGKLAVKAGLDVSGREELLDVLTRAVEWRGRYPINKKNEALYPPKTWMELSGSPVAEAKVNIDAIYEELREMFKKRGKEPASSGETG